jgi:hypothetical protein
MYCPKCRTEYRKGFDMCSDCDVALVAELSPILEGDKTDKGFHPIRDQINKTIEFIGSNRNAAWLFSILIGLLFKYAYGFVKNLWAHSILSVLDYAASLMEPLSNLNSVKNVLITIGVNLLTDLPAAFIASLICSALMIYVLRKQRLLYSLGAVASFFLLYSRRWHFRNAPDLGVQISAFIAPFLIAAVFIFSVWLLIKFQFKRTKD